MEKQRRAYNLFRVDAWNTKNGKGYCTPEQMVERLAALLQSGNVFAVRAVRAAAELHKPSGIRPNAVWDGTWDADVAKGVAKHFWNIVS